MSKFCRFSCGASGAKTALIRKVILIVMKALLFISQAKFRLDLRIIRLLDLAKFKKEWVHERNAK